MHQEQTAEVTRPAGVVAGSARRLSIAPGLQRAAAAAASAPAGGSEPATPGAAPARCGTCANAANHLFKAVVSGLFSRGVGILLLAIRRKLLHLGNNAWQEFTGISAIL